VIFAILKRFDEFVMVATCTYLW